MPQPLEPGDELRCPHCQRWRAVYSHGTQGTEETMRMLYFVCQGLDYFAGTRGFPIRHPTRRGQSVSRSVIRP